MDPSEKIRTIITQDAEVDDQNSLRHFLLYANEVDLQGIVQTASKFHWAGVPGAVKPPKTRPDDFEGVGEESGPFDRPYRWPGTAWMDRVLDDYEQDYPRLCRAAESYPAPETLRSITKVGNVGYEGEMEAPTEGSELIRRRILDDDPRPLYLQVWGGCNTIARALLDIELAHRNDPDWPALRLRLAGKLVITACGEQDPAYRQYIARVWPEIPFVKTLQMGSYAYPWKAMPEGDSKDTLRAAFMKKEILNGKSALASGYCTWMDGKRYEGEVEESQFGANPRIAEEWFGASFGLPRPEPYDFLSEGDSPTFFLLLGWGLRTLENFAWGGVSGRFRRVEGEVNDLGQPLNYWDVCRDAYTDREGHTAECESMWPYVADIQRDFAARVAWCDPARTVFEHRPALEMAQGVDRTARPGEEIALTAVVSEGVTVSFRVYPEISAPWAQTMALAQEEAALRLQLPETARPGEQVHVIVRAQAPGHFRLARYRQVIITIQ